MFNYFKENIESIVVNEYGEISFFVEIGGIKKKSK